MIEKLVWIKLHCDDCNEFVDGSSVSEVVAEARHQGWKLGRADHCGCRERAEAYVLSYELDREEERWLKHLERLRAAVKVTPCPSCGVGVNEKCRSNNGWQYDNWTSMHAARLKAARR